MSLISLSGVSILAACLSLLLRESGSKLSPFVAIGAGIFVLTNAFLSLSGLWERLFAFAENEALGSAVTVAMKAVGLGYVTEIASGICRDLGEGATAARLEVCGRLSILAVGLPFFLSVLEEALSYVAA